MTTATSPTPTAVVFDLGKVLLEFDYGIVARRLAAHSGRDAEQIRGLLDQSPLLFRLESGQMTNEEFFDEVSSLTGYTGGFGEFANIFGDIFSAIHPMIDLHGQLRARGVPTFIFSNTNELAVRHIRANYAFFAHFTDYIYSHEAGAMKSCDFLFLFYVLFNIGTLSEEEKKTQPRPWRSRTRTTQKKTERKKYY